MNSALTLDKPSDFPSIFAASFGIGAFGLALGLTYPLLSLLMAERGVAPSIIGLNAAAMGVGIALSTLLLSRLTAQFSAGWLITAGLLGSAMVILMFGYTRDLTTWFLLRIILGFHVNAVFVLTEAWVNAASSEAIRGRAVSSYTMSLSVGFAVGPLGIPLLGTQTVLPFAVCAVLVSLTAVGIALLSRRAKVRTEVAPRGSLQRFAVTAPLLVVMVMAFGFSDWTLISVMPIYFLEKGMTAPLASITVSVVHFGMILFALPIGLALDRLPRLSVGALCAAGTAISYALLPLLPSHSWGIWVALLVLGGCSVGLYTTALTVLGEKFSGGMLVAGSAIFSMGFTVAGTLGMVGTGAALQIIGYNAVPIGFSACFFVLLIAILFNSHRIRKD